MTQNEFLREVRVSSRVGVREEKLRNHYICLAKKNYVETEAGARVMIKDSLGGGGVGVFSIAVVP